MATTMKKKTESVAPNREKRPYAVAKYIRVSPYKVRTVLALIRGKSYREAKAILDYSVNGSALRLRKFLCPRRQMQNITWVWTETTCS